MVLVFWEMILCGLNEAICLQYFGQAGSRSTLFNLGLAHPASSISDTFSDRTLFHPTVG